MKCHHDATVDSTLKLLQVRSVVETDKWRYSVTCGSCGRMTNWFRTVEEARLEAYYQCWMEEY